MSKRLFLLTGSLFFLLLLALSITIPTRNRVQAEASSQTTPVGIPISRNNDGLIQNNLMGVFGPQICTRFGDPFSPFNSPWEPGSYTYRYRIMIPADYDDDVVRVELFDPDSVNRDDNMHTIQRSRFATNPDEEWALDEIETIKCGQAPRIDDPSDKIPGDPVSSPLQRNPCVLLTKETDLVFLGHATIDQINPYWFVRVDENRGVGPDHEDGTCNPPLVAGESQPPYNLGYNTQTRFELYYYRQTTDGQPVEVPIASYIGNTGDSRDYPFGGDHQTDLRWVSPGADKQGNDYPIPDVPGVSEVPTTEGDTSFEVRLADVSNIVVDPVTGDRVLYLDVTALSGASENAYHIWAGPDDYVETTPTDVNLRNLTALDNPGSHDSRGVQIEAISRLTSDNLYGYSIDVPLGDFTASAAGGEIYISTFDLDSGANPPLTFYFDSIDRNDWSMTFSDPGVDDPDGVAAGIRCNIENNGCNDSWTSPAYRIDIPGDLSQCDFLNPTSADCTPFTGGRLMVDLNGGQYDTYAWEITADLSTTLDPNRSCAAFPIAVHNGVQSVTPPGEGANPYPDASEFDYPVLPPAYDDFQDHDPGISLSQANEGDLFYMQNGFGSGDFGWLLWNVGKPAYTATLADSLRWPGDSLDYADHADPGIVVANGIPYVVRGYVEPGDATDLTMNVEDWVAAFTGSVNSNSVRDALSALVDAEYELRLIVWDESQDSGSFGEYKIQRFGVFKIVGFHLSLGTGSPWLLLEFMGFDDSCGQRIPDLAIDSLQVVEPTAIYAGEPFTVTVTISNTFIVDITTPFEVNFYLSEPAVDDTPPIAEGSIGGQTISGLVAGASETITLQINQSPQQGNHQLFALVDTFDDVSEPNESNNIVGPVAFQVLPERKPDLEIGELEIIDGDNLHQDEPIVAQMVISNTGTADVDDQFFVNVYLNPSQIDPLPSGESVGFTAVSSLAVNSQKTITITIPGGTSQLLDNKLYAAVDLSGGINETDETNNIDGPLNFDVLEKPKPDLQIGDLQIIDVDSLRQDEPIVAQMVVANTGTADVDDQFFVDVHLNPSQTDPLPSGESVGFTAVSSLAVNSQKTITITIPGGTSQQFNNVLYATVDWSNSINETDETNNETSLLDFDVLPLEDWLVYLPFVIQIGD